MKLKNILEKAVRREASDIHLTVGVEATIRINGRLEKLTNQKLSVSDLKAVMTELLDKDTRAEFEEAGEVDFAYHLDDYHFRVNAFHQQGDPAAALRILPDQIPQLDDLGVPKELKEVVKKPRGLFLVTGPTGSGKSTTLAAMINRVNQRRDKHIITLEDPIEYVHEHQKSIINQREIGRDTQGFAPGLRAALRQDPDIILVGEMRDLETISTALKAAETGHLVLATLHTNGASETIERIINVFPPHQQTQVRTQLALSLQGVLSQQLLPTIDGQDRVVATEMLVINSAVQNLIREGKTHQLESVMQTGKDEGMHTMDYSLRELYLQGDIRRKEAMAKADDEKILDNML